MRLSYSWLCDYIKEPISVSEMAEILTSVGLEVEQIGVEEKIKGGLKNLVVGYVQECIPHPNADKLKLTKVDIGEEKLLQIVCGAPNVAQGQKVIVAPVGTQLYPQGAEMFEIKKAKIRGEESEGMICAEDEIGMGQSHDGIVVLPEDIKIGSALSAYYQIPPSETFFDIGLTPNRMDAMSHMGAAKDIAAYLSNKKNSIIQVQKPSLHLKAKTASLPFEIEIQDKEKCPRYMGLSISNVKIASSPTWLQQKLLSIGLQPINNVVDITNFVLHECGQPLHAFDYDSIDQQKIIVRVAKQDEKFITLDGKERNLNSEDLLISNPNSPMVIAGVFGGLHSGVKNETKNIFLESAYFSPVGIRKTATRLQLRTEAAAHYEKGVDISNLPFALMRAAQLILEICGGEIASEVVDVYPQPKEKNQIKFSLLQVQKLAGKKYTVEQVENILHSLEFDLIQDEENFTVQVPYAKHDVSQLADIVEEIMRIDGLDNIPFTGKIEYAVHQYQNSKQKIKQQIAEDLSAIGFFEIINNSITNSKYYPEKETLVALRNNLSAELDVMRPSMLFAALQCIAHNVNRKNEELRFFEFGKIYFQKNENYIEEEKLGLYICGTKAQQHWQKIQVEPDLYYCKGLVQYILPEAQFKNGKEIYLNKNKIGEIVQVEKKDKDIFGIEKEVWCIVMDALKIIQAKENVKKQFVEIPKYPGTFRDLALVINKEITYEQIEKIVKTSAGKNFRGLHLFDVFESDKIGKDKKSYAIRLQFLDTEKTLTYADVENDMQKIQTSLEQGVAAEIRGL